MPQQTVGSVGYLRGQGSAAFFHRVAAAVESGLQLFFFAHQIAFGGGLSFLQRSDLLSDPFPGGAEGADAFFGLVQTADGLVRIPVGDGQGLIAVFFLTVYLGLQLFGDGVFSGAAGIQLLFKFLLLPVGLLQQSCGLFQLGLLFAFAEQQTVLLVLTYGQGGGGLGQTDLEIVRQPVQALLMLTVDAGGLLFQLQQGIAQAAVFQLCLAQVVGGSGGGFFQGPLFLAGVIVFGPGFLDAVEILAASGNQTAQAARQLQHGVFRVLAAAFRLGQALFRLFPRILQPGQIGGVAFYIRFGLLQLVGFGPGRSLGLAG